MNEEIKLNLDELEKNIEEQTAEEIRNEHIEESAQEEKPVDDIPRNEDGTINIDLIATGKDNKNNYIVPDDLFDKYFRELPQGTKNESKTWRASSGGKIKILTADDRDIQIQGGKALQATLRQRRTFAEAISAVLAQKASEETRKELNLDSTADNLDAVIAAMLRQATRGNVKAGDFLRDTIGQKPSDRLEATVENLTPEDRQMLENIKNRLDS